MASYFRSLVFEEGNNPDSKVHGANMGPIWMYYEYNELRKINVIDEAFFFFK